MNGRGRRPKKNVACQGKQRLTKSQALKGAYDLESKTGAKMMAYKCSYCKGWHFGHKMRPKYKAS